MVGGDNPFYLGASDSGFTIRQCAPYKFAYYYYYYYYYFLGPLAQSRRRKYYYYLKFWVKLIRLER